MSHRRNTEDPGGRLGLRYQGLTIPDSRLVYMPSIRITKTPPGEAPEYIRRAWVGVVIPLPDDTGQRWRSPSRSNVFVGPRVFVHAVLGLVRRKNLTWDKYTVEAMEAFDALRRSDPDAAAWWHINAPHLMRPGRKITFPVRVCELEGVGSREAGLVD